MQRICYCLPICPPWGKRHNQSPQAGHGMAQSFLQISWLKSLTSTHSREPLYSHQEFRDHPCLLRHQKLTKFFQSWGLSKGRAMGSKNKTHLGLFAAPCPAEGQVKMIFLKDLLGPGSKDLNHIRFLLGLP